MTDNEIIKALEVCANNGDCEECAINPHHGNYGYCTSLAIKAALDLIKRQQAEIERLNHIRAELSKEIDRLKEAANPYRLHYGALKAEIAREFADRLTDTADLTQLDSFNYAWLINQENIDNLLKEMEKEDEDSKQR